MPDRKMYVSVLPAMIWASINRTLDIVAERGDLNGVPKTTFNDIPGSDGMNIDTWLKAQDDKYGADIHDTQGRMIYDYVVENKAAIIENIVGFVKAYDRIGKTAAVVGDASDLRMALYRIGFYNDDVMSLRDRYVNPPVFETAATAVDLRKCGEYEHKCVICGRNVDMGDYISAPLNVKVCVDCYSNRLLYDSIGSVPKLLSYIHGHTSSAAFDALDPLGLRTRADDDIRFGGARVCPDYRALLNIDGIFAPSTAEPLAIIRNTGELVSQKKIGQTFSVDGRTLHTICRCETCNWVYATDDVYKDTRICSGCKAAKGDCRTVRCFNCGTACSAGITAVKDARQPDSESWICTNCAASVFKAVHEYSYKPIPIFIFKDKPPKDGRYFGLEIEVSRVDGKERSIHDVAHIVDTVSESQRLFYMKPDSSVWNGIEIVSHPMSMDFITNEYAWDKFYACLRDVGMSAEHESCGLHVHMGKDDMSQTHRVLYSMFFNYQRTRTVAIAQRENPTFAYFKDIARINGSGNRAEFCQTYNRHEALNWANSHTVEIRVFKGTDSPDILKAYVEYCDAVYRFSRLGTVNMELMVQRTKCWRAFREFIDDRPEYNHLLVHINSSGVKAMARKKNHII